MLYQNLIQQVTYSFVEEIQQIIVVVVLSIVCRFIGLTSSRCGWLLFRYLPARCLEPQASRERHCLYLYSKQSMMKTGSKFDLTWAGMHQT